MLTTVDWRCGPQPQPRPQWARNLTSRGEAHRDYAERTSNGLARVVEWLAADPNPDDTGCRYGPISSPRVNLPSSDYPHVSDAQLAIREPSTRYILRSSVITPFAPSPLLPEEIFADTFEPCERDRVNGRHQRWIGADTMLDGKTVWPFANLDLSPMSGSPSPTPSPEPQTPTGSPDRRPAASKSYGASLPSSGPSGSSTYRPSGGPSDSLPRRPSDPLPPRPDSGKGKGKALAFDLALPSIPLEPTSQIMKLRPLAVTHITSAPRFQPAPPEHPDVAWVSTVSSTGVMVCPTHHLNETAWRALGRLESAHRAYFLSDDSWTGPDGNAAGLGPMTVLAREFNALTAFPSTMQHRLLRDDKGQSYMLSHWDVAALERWISEYARCCGLRRWAKRQNRRVRPSSGSWGWRNAPCWRQRSFSDSWSSESESSRGSFGAIGDDRPSRTTRTITATATRTMTNAAGGDNVAGSSTATPTATNTVSGDGVVGQSTRRRTLVEGAWDTARRAVEAQRRPVMHFATTPIGGITFRDFRAPRDSRDSHSRKSSADYSVASAP